MAKTVADLVIERLIGWGVKAIFSLPGDGIHGMFEALRTHKDQLKYVQVRHEEAAAFAACGYAKYAGGLGVCLATSGPGGIHLLNGLYDAKYDGQPVLAITGHTFHDLIGTHFQQDVDLDKLFMDVAAYNERIMGPAHVPSVVDNAVKTALSQRTVAHLTIPKDIQEWNTSDTQLSEMEKAGHSSDLYAPAFPLPPRELLQQAADVINRGSKVALLVGRGCLGARDQVLRLAELVGGSITTALLGKGVVPEDSPYLTGCLGLLGSAPASDAMRECDTLVILGSSFPYHQFLPKPGQAKSVQVDVDPTRIGLRYPVDVALVGDCAHVLDALLPLLHRKHDRSYLERTQKNIRDWNELIKQRANRMDKPIKPQLVADRLNNYLADDAVICCDTGSVTTWAARYIRMKGRMQFSASGMLATMGNGMPYAVGAAIAFPGRQVVAFCGDGGFTMMMGEMATLVKYQLPVKVILIKNNVLGQVTWEQLVLGDSPQYGVELQPIDFAAYARACGAAGFTLEDPHQTEELLAKAFAHPGPALLEVVVDPNEPPIPGHVSTREAWNFTRALARGQPEAREIVKKLAADKIRQVV